MLPKQEQAHSTASDLWAVGSKSTANGKHVQETHPPGTRRIVEPRRAGRGVGRGQGKGQR